jgi:hypothetical protein
MGTVRDKEFREAIDTLYEFVQLRETLVNMVVQRTRVEQALRVLGQLPVAVLDRLADSNSG